MSGSIDVEACAADPLVQGAVLSDPTVQAGITQKCMAQIGLVVQTATDRCTATVNDMSTTYGSTSILIGFTLPLIYLGLSVSIWRMWTKPSLRGGLLLFAMVLTVVDSGTLIAGKIHAPTWLMEPYNYRSYVFMLLTVPAIRNSVIVTAASLRYAVVYTNDMHQKLLIGGLSSIAVISMALSLGIGIRDVNAQGYVGKGYWAAVIVDPIAYIVAGVATFTTKLRTTRQRVKASGAPGSNIRMASLETANNIVMGFTLAACVITVGIVYALDVNTNFYVTPIAFFTSASWTVGENLFEMITMMQGFFVRGGKSASNILSSTQKAKRLEERASQSAQRLSSA